MVSTARTFTLRTLQLLPPFRPLRIRPLNAWRLLRFHLIVTSALYSVFLMLAATNGTLWSSDGIGVLQNPPFFGHLAITALSIPLVLVLIKRVGGCLSQASKPRLRPTFFRLLAKSRALYFLYGSFVLGGLMSLAASIVMASTIDVDIYDSAGLHPSTFVGYSLIRIYQYIFCYPLLLATPLIIMIVFFRALQNGEVRYEPFAVDEMGGLKQYLRAIDRPIYAIQLISTIIAITNYIGWGELGLVPAILVFAVVIVVTLIGGVLHLSFIILSDRLRSSEIGRIRKQQDYLYEQILLMDQRGSEHTKIFVEEIEAGDRLVQIIRRRKNYGWAKYALNLAVAASTPLLKLASGDSPGLYGELTTNILNNVLP